MCALIKFARQSNHFHNNNNNNKISITNTMTIWYDVRADQICSTIKSFQPGGAFLDRSQKFFFFVMKCNVEYFYQDL